MKTLEVLDKVLRGKKMSYATRIQMSSVMRRFAEYSPEWPGNGSVVNEWLVSQGGKAEKSLQSYFLMLRIVNKYAVKWLKLPDAVEGVELPKVSRKPRRYLSREEWVRVIRACETEWERLAVLTLSDSGCREGGLGMLRVENIGDGFFVTMEKTKELQRYRLDKGLCERLKRFGGSGYVFKIGGEESDDVSHEKWRRGQAVGERVKRIMERAGLSGRRLGAHAIRHSVGSLVARETQSSLAVKAVLGHESVKTSEIYIHDVEDDIAQGISPLRVLVEDVLGEEGSSQLMLPAPGECGRGGGVVEKVVEAWDGELPVIGDGVSVRPKLDADDLGIIREVFRQYIMSDGTGQLAVRCRELFVRMVRRVKVGG